MPNRKKWVQYFALILFCIGITGFLGMGLSLTFTTWGIAFLLFIWDHQTDKKDKQEFKRKYISRFLPAQLRVSLQNPNLVYKVISQNNNKLTIQTIWSGDQPKLNVETYEVPHDEVKPFDEEAFINFT